MMTADRQPPGQELSPPATGTGSGIEKAISVAILVVLAAIAMAVVLRQNVLNPAVLAIRETAAASAPKRELTSTVAPPANLDTLGTPEQFTPENLYDKIDGKAELYLAAGFVQMRCQRFALRAAPDQWFEWAIYDMGTLPRAFSVFSTQRRPEGKPLNLTPYAYRTQNALYFVSGSNYVEAVASDASELLVTAMLAMAGGFVAADATVNQPLPELGVFPTDGLVPNSQSLQITDAFGFDQLKNVFTAQYRLADATLMAFVTSCSDPIAAVGLRDAYAAFLVSNGGKPGANDSLGKRIEIMGGTEIIFSQGRFFAGIHSATALSPAEQIARQLRERLTPAGAEQGPSR